MIYGETARLCAATTSIFDPAAGPMWLRNLVYEVHTRSRNGSERQQYQYSASPNKHIKHSGRSARADHGIQRPPDRYRSELQTPSANVTNSQLRRLVRSASADCFNEMADAVRPIARGVSNLDFLQVSECRNLVGASNFVRQWSPLLDHDINSGRRMK